ncbi:MAG TPA: hypothetical protein PKI30_04225, partial [Bacillota bacterium]|nr:hypothetical protein [Bacillota bacterium]
MDGDYVCFTILDVPSQLVQGKAYLRYKLDGKSYDRTLYPQHFAEDGKIENNKLRVKKTVFGDELTKDNLTDVELTLFTTLPPAQDT